MHRNMKEYYESVLTKIEDAYPSRGKNRTTCDDSFRGSCTDCVAQKSSPSVDQPDIDFHHYYILVN